MRLGYWPLKVSKHTAAEYARWFETSLRIPVPYVFFTEDIAAFRNFSKGRPDLPTLYVQKPLHMFKSHHLLPDEDEAAVVGPSQGGVTHPVHVPSRFLAAVWLEKMNLLHQAAQIAPEQVQFFAWVDAGR
jgi:hypothetical protein